MGKETPQPRSPETTEGSSLGEQGSHRPAPTGNTRDTLLHGAGKVIKEGSK